MDGVVATSEIEPILGLRQYPDVGIRSLDQAKALWVPGSGGVFDVPGADAEGAVHGHCAGQIGHPSKCVSCSRRQAPQYAAGPLPSVIVSSSLQMWPERAHS